MVYFRVVSGTGLDSWLVKHTTRSEFSHAEFVLPESKQAFGAYLDGVSFRPLDYAHFDREVWFTAPRIDEALCWAVKQNGKKYDFSAIVGIFADRDWRDCNKFFCSELVALAFERAGAPILNPQFSPWRITPRDILLSPVIEKVKDIRNG